MLNPDPAFSGNEVCPAMIKDVGCEWVILGHQERKYICENAEFCVENGLNVLLCIGEKLKGPYINDVSLIFVNLYPLIPCQYQFHATSLP